MKIFYHFLIIVFIALSLYLVRGDVSLVVHKIYNHYYPEQVKPTTSSFEVKKELPLVTKVDIPGALRVVDKILNVNTKLTKENVILLTNQARQKNGNLVALRENTKLDNSAQNKLEDMFGRQYFEHISPTGRGISDLSQDVGYEYILIGENLALGNFSDDQALIDAWMASPGHRANILNKHYTEIGVAVGQGLFEGKKVWLGVQHFGTPRSTCPQVDQVLLGTINLTQVQITDMEANLNTRKDMIDKGVIYEGSTYSEQIDQYNNLVKIYNNLIINLKNKIDQYNNQIRNLNLCIINNQ